VDNRRQTAILNGCEKPTSFEEIMTMVRAMLLAEQCEQRRVAAQESS